MSSYDLSEAFKDIKDEHFFRISDVMNEDNKNNAIPPQARDEDEV